MQREMEMGGTALFFDLFVALSNHLVSDVICSLMASQLLPRRLHFVHWRLTIFVGRC